MDYIKLDGITDGNGSDIEISGPDEGAADACDAPPFTGCLSVFPLTGYSWWSDRRFAAVAAPIPGCPWPRPRLS